MLLILLGAVLVQLLNGQWTPISFSRKLSDSETHYPSFDRQLLAIYLSIRHFHHFMKGWGFHVDTDHMQLNFAVSSNLDKWTLDRPGICPSSLNSQVTFVVYKERITLLPMLFHRYKVWKQPAQPHWIIMSLLSTS